MTSPDGNAVMVFLVDPDRRTLLVRPHGQLSDYWMPPGGHIDPGETPAVAACREVAEELHVRCVPDDLHYLASYAKDIGRGNVTLFEAHVQDSHHLLGPEILEAQWVDLHASQTLPMLPVTSQALRLVIERNGSDHHD